MRVLHQYIDRLWPSEFVPLNLIYAEVVTINKNKSDKSILGNHRGILPIFTASQSDVAEDIHTIAEPILLEFPGSQGVSVSIGLDINLSNIRQHQATTKLHRVSALEQSCG